MTAKTATRRPREETKRVLLQAGLELLVSESTKGDFSVKLRDVVDRADRTTGSAYQIWKSQTEYRRDLALYVAESVEYADPAPIGEVVASTLDPSADLEEVIGVIGAAYFDYFYQRPEFTVFLRLASVTHTDPEVSEAVLRGYDKLRERLGVFLEFAVVTQAGRTYAPGVTIGQISSIVTALTEGFAVKARFCGHADPEQSTERIDEIRSNYVTSLIALTSAMTIHGS